MTTKTYNKKYAKTVKARYLSDYKRQELYIYTNSKDIYINHLGYIKANFKNYIIARQGKAYIIIVKGTI